MTEENVKTDGSGKRYVEVSTDSGERVRLTFVPAETAGYKVESIRIQIRDAPGKVRPGPEIPLRILGDVFGGIVLLLSS